MPHDEAQLFSADELCNRGWFYHKEHQVWFTRVPNSEPVVKTPTYERGSYYFFDPTVWETGRKDNFVLQYEMLEALGSSHNTLTCQPSPLSSALLLPPSRPTTPQHSQDNFVLHSSRPRASSGEAMAASAELAAYAFHAASPRLRYSGTGAADNSSFSASSAFAIVPLSSRVASLRIVSRAPLRRSALSPPTFVAHAASRQQPEEHVEEIARGDIEVRGEKVRLAERNGGMRVKNRSASLKNGGESNREGNERRLERENRSEERERRSEQQGKVRKGMAVTRRQVLATAAAAAAAGGIAERAAAAGLVIPGARSWRGGNGLGFVEGEESGGVEGKGRGGAGTSVGSALDSLSERVCTFMLANGMRWIVVERRAAPIVSCHTYADVGAADEADGCTGVAHLLEHLAFKGTPVIGTRDAQKEARLLELVDEAFYGLKEAREGGAAEGTVKRLEDEFARLQQQAAELSVPNAFGALVSREGGVGLNATTSQDSTQYFVSLPANKLELWMALESGRFLAPVFRELYSEKEVVREERRLRIDNTPYGRFTEAFAQRAFPHSPYGRPTIGYPSDFDRLGRKEVEAFFQQHYTPDKLTCAVVGDVSAAEVERLATKYFAPWQPITSPSEPILALPFSLASSSSPLLLASAFPLPLSSSPPLSSTTPSLNPISSSSSSASRAWRSGSREEGWEAARMAAAAVGEEREMRMSVGANPLYFEGKTPCGCYFRPYSSSVDDPVISVISSLLYGSRSSRLYKNLVLPGKALSASATETYPGDKRPSLFLLSAFPPLGGTTDAAAAALQEQPQHMTDTRVPLRLASRLKLPAMFCGTTDAVAAALQEQLQHMADTRVPESDLARVRKSLRELLGSNAGLARVCCEYSMQAGRWEALVEEVQSIEEVTPTSDTLSLLNRLKRPRALEQQFRLGEGAEYSTRAGRWKTLVEEVQSIEEVTPRDVCKKGRHSLELLGSNSGLARVLCEYSTRAGRWEALVEEVQSIEEVTPRDVQQSDPGIVKLDCYLFRLLHVFSLPMHLSSPPMQFFSLPKHHSVGGGYPVGGIVLLIEDSLSPLHLILLRYFLSQGLSHSHPLLLLSPLPDPQAFLATLPAPAEGKAGSGALAGPVGRAGPGGLSEPQGLGWSQEERRAGGVGRGESVGDGGGGGDGLRIAWQYKHLAPQFTGVGSGGAAGASVPYCTEFDLRTPLSRPSLRHAQQLCTCVPLWVDALTAGTGGSCTQQELAQNGDSGATSGFTQDLFGRVSGFLSSLDSNVPADAASSAPGGSTGAGLRGVGGGGGGGSGEAGGRVGRIGVHSLGAPPSLLLSGDDALVGLDHMPLVSSDTFFYFSKMHSLGAPPSLRLSGDDAEVLAWLQWLKGCVRTLPVTVLVTIPRDEGVIPPHVLLRLQHAADLVLAMEALEEDNAELASGISDYKDALGLIRIRKVSMQNSLVPRMPAVTTLVLRAVNRKRQIVVEEAHPPPIDATGGAAGSSGRGGSVGCGSSGGGSNALDF
ncbi:unnamed protein product, partial [Closterium sp. NIES-65]